VDKGGLDLMKSAGRIDSNEQMRGKTSRRREAEAHGRYGTGKVYSEDQVRQILRNQGD
jgi:hypothetical protein